MVKKGNIHNTLEYTMSKAISTAQLLILPHAGGHEFQYLELKNALKDEYKVQVLDLPSRGKNSRQNYSDWSIFKEEIISFVEKYVDNNTYLLGHSYGSLLAYEITKKIPIKGLMVSAFYPPLKAYQPSIPKTTHLDEESFIEYLTKYGAIDKRLFEDKKTKDFFLSGLRNDFNMLESYVPQEETVNVPLCCFLGEEDNIYELSEMRDWCKLTDSEFSLHLIKGDHFGFLSQPNFIKNTIIKFIGSTNEIY